MDHLTPLFRKNLDNTATDAEKQQLMEMIAGNAHDEQLLQLLDEFMAATGDEHALSDSRAQEILQIIVQSKLPARKVRKLHYRWWAAAAVILPLIIATVLYHRSSKPAIAPAAAIAANDIQPVHQSAVLTLSNGQQLLLDSIPAGIIPGATGNTIRLQQGSLAYSANSYATGYNILSTPKGRLFHVLLPDGSAVWLNAASSLKYPAAFTNDRTVELNGEAYFEVAANSRHPFRVITPSGEVKVLGTGFNVNAYTNEVAMKTTLLHGRVQVSTHETVKMLQPGEQATLNAGNIHIAKADTLQVTAWKEGYFNFDNAGIATVMNQLQRWYDIEVIYENGIPDITFGGKMEHNLNLNNILRILEISNVHYRLDGKKLIITQ